MSTLKTSSWISTERPPTGMACRSEAFVVFDHGELLAEGLASEVMQRPEVMRAYLGQAVDVESGRA